MLKLWKYGEEKKKKIVFYHSYPTKLSLKSYILHCGIFVPACLSNDRKITFKCLYYIAQKSARVRDVRHICFVQTLSIKWPEMCNLTFCEVLTDS